MMLPMRKAGITSNGSGLYGLDFEYSNTTAAMAKSNDVTMVSGLG